VTGSENCVAIVRSVVGRRREREREQESERVTAVMQGIPTLVVANKIDVDYKVRMSLLVERAQAVLRSPTKHLHFPRSMVYRFSLCPLLMARMLLRFSRQRFGAFS
jgi:hypothetical protein